ncbi:MAG: hypothetical protein ACOCYT_03865 [Chloroflexota bacterium]
MKKLLLLLVLLLAVPVVLAQDDGENDPAVTPAVRDQIDALEAYASDVRELPALASVERLFPTRAEAIETLRGQLDQELTDVYVLESMQFYRAFDFITDDLDLESLFTELITSQVAGFYDPRTDEMNVLLLSKDADLADGLPPLERVIYVHEYIHALQDQHFDLSTLREGVEEPDHLLAITALIEGDATYVMQQYTLRLIQQEPQAIEALLEFDASGAAELPSGTPEVLEAELIMPYLAGLNFVGALVSNGGWEAVDAAFDNPPVSTEQVLHPRKYIDGELPLTVEVVDAVEVLGEGWSLLNTRTLGEFYLDHYLMTQLDGDIAGDAAEGWGGDRYHLYYNAEADQRAWVMRLAWDTPGDRDEFVEAFAAFMAARLDTLEDESCGTTADDTLCMLAAGEDVILAYAPQLEQARALLDAQAVAVP